MLATLNDLIWSKILLFTLVPIGLYFTLRSGFVQFRYFGRMFGVLAQGFSHRGSEATSFQALALSVAGRVGAGNIAGVAVAITLGGPGAIFWMWLVGLVGMATSFFECSLAQLFKTREPDGNFRGGPAYYIEKGLKPLLGAGSKGLAYLYSFLLLLTFGIAFIVVQSFAVSTSIEGAFGVPSMATGVVLAILIGIVILGGVSRIASVVEIIVPVMAIGYVGLVLFIIATNLSYVPAAFSTIFRHAFGLEEAVAGGVGAAILQGIRRGLFSNEAGLGSAPNVAAIAYVAHPGQQGIVQALSVFIDTIILCTCTALIIIMSGVPLGDAATDGVILTQTALAEHVGDWAEIFVAVALFLFVVSSIMYNYYLGETAVDYFFQDNKAAFFAYRVIAIGFVLVGAMVNLGAAFGFADVTMGLLALVNLFALVLLSPIAFRLLRDFDAEFRAKRVPVLDPEAFADLDLDHAAWQLHEADEAWLEKRRQDRPV
ncbi:alanine/glycine:cation symporter family protein [Parvularcula marina]|uniref:alanine/glycine:cation symporter family protein n=1 Tax=Parvularcula marina TaxID=2292771 RepID=UPI0035183266